MCELFQELVKESYNKKRWEKWSHILSKQSKKS